MAQDQAFPPFSCGDTNVSRALAGFFPGISGRRPGPAPHSPAGACRARFAPQRAVRCRVSSRLPAELGRGALAECQFATVTSASLRAPEGPARGRAGPRLRRPHALGQKGGTDHSSSGEPRRERVHARDGVTLAITRLGCGLAWGIARFTRGSERPGRVPRSKLRHDASSRCVRRWGSAHHTDSSSRATRTEARACPAAAIRPSRSRASPAPPTHRPAACEVGAGTPRRPPPRTPRDRHPVDTVEPRAARFPCVQARL